MVRRRRLRTETAASADEGSGRAILEYLKRRRDASVADLAAHLDMSYEGARLHLRRLLAAGLVLEAPAARPNAAGAGRPVARYALSPEAEDLFPKDYDELAVGLIDALSERLGEAALKQVLAAFTERRVREWAPRLAGKSLPERLEALKSIYGEGDPYMTVEPGPRAIRLIEYNCPFLNVARRRPALCSVTVSALRQLLGVRVVREERFQAGHGRCVFRVLPEHPLAEDERDFALEAEQSDTLA